MATTFQVKRSSVAGKVPNTSTLSIGELGLNLTDQILYSSNGTGVFELGANVTNQTIKTSLLVGNSSVNTTVNSTSISVGSNNLTVGTSLYAVSNGNVGIGTSSPTNKLHVFGGASKFEVSSGNMNNIFTNGTITGQLFIGNTNSTDQMMIGPSTSHPLIFRTSNSDRVTITSAGNVGIGTSSPSYTLDVNGSSRTDYILFRSNTTAPTADAAIYRPADGTLGLVTNSTERMRITSAGNVGIGTASPDTILDARKSNASYWGQTTTNTWGGTLTPPQALTITNSQPNGYDPVLLFRQATSTGTIKTAGAIGLVGGSNWIDGNDATQYSNMYFAIRNTTGGLQEIMRFTVDGRVGIGTVSPGYRLHVGESSGIAIYGSSSTNHGVYGISSSQYGVVGISTSGIGTYGQSSSSSGVYGTSSTGTGLYGLSTSNYGAYTQSTNNYGIYGRTLNSGFGGVIGYNYDASKYAILAYSTNYAIYGAGDAYFSGALSKGSGSFNIPHPLPELSETHRLVHSFVEAPTADNIYRGRLQLENGQATVNIDTHVGMTEGTFSALNGNIQVFLQNDSGWDLVRGSVTDNILTIISQNQSSTDNISWMVIGERQDQHMLDTQWTDEFGRPILEPLKEPEPEIQLPPEPEVPNENG